MRNFVRKNGPVNSVKPYEVLRYIYELLPTILRAC
jgi:hypothetical protein